MGNIVELFIDRGDRVIIDGGIVTETVTHSQRGVERIMHAPGVRRYFVDVIQADGGGGVWDGASYEDALEVARECSAELGNAPIINRVRA